MPHNRRTVGVWWLLQKADGTGKPWQWSVARGLRAGLREARELNERAPAGRAWITETQVKDRTGSTC